VSLASTYEEKQRIIKDIFSKMSHDEKSIMLRMFIKEDMKLFFETIWDEQKFLEEETGIDGAMLLEDTSEKAWYNGEEVSKEEAEKEKAWDNGFEVNSAGAVSKEAENAYYLDEKISAKQGDDKLDGFLGYVNASAYGEENTEYDSLNNSPYGEAVEFGEITEEEKK